MIEGRGQGGVVGPHDRGQVPGAGVGGAEETPVDPVVGVEGPLKGRRRRVRVGPQRGERRARLQGALRIGARLQQKRRKREI